ncbi:MAG: SAM-dependent methyltransferase [Bacteriovoracaceae bacterium]
MESYTLYLAIHEFEKELEKEFALKGLNFEKRDRLYLVEGHHPPMIWAQASGLRAQKIAIESINDGARKLKALQRNWALFTIENHRRAQLIQGELPKYNTKPIPFMKELPSTPMGLWTLWEPNLIVAAQETSSLFPLGEMTFEEDKINPPSRAYLKLWEFFTVHAPRNHHGGISIDVGSCPGGWTWVLSTLGYDVISVDKAPLDPKIAARKGVQFMEQSAFALTPKDVPELEWFCSDIICYPSRLLILVNQFLDSGKVKNFACTLKYQNETDWESTNRFLEIPGSKIVHLHHNKHEVTWFKIS